MWFEQLSGFPESSADRVRSHIRIKGDYLVSDVNQSTWLYGQLETPNLAELRQRLSAIVIPAHSQNIVGERIANIQTLHLDPLHTNALFQVASQFNLLEMVGPRFTPEMGVSIYELDMTQGPACAIAAGAGTIYRNYFVPLKGQTGQSSQLQIDCLADVGQLLGNTHQQLWRMENGYALPTLEGLFSINQRLNASNALEIDTFRSALRIGLLWNTQVTLGGAKHTVSQAFCSALPIAYCQHSTALWEKFSVLILEASYEATLISAVMNAIKTGQKNVFLTLLGGGAFGNKTAWILSAIERALQSIPHMGLKIHIVSYQQSQAPVQALLKRIIKKVE